MPVEPTSTRVPDEIRRQLGFGEKVLWHGRPRRGLLLRGADALFIPLGVLWLGLLVGNPEQWYPFAPATPLLLLPGLYLAGGRYVADACARGATWYAVTGERVIIVSGIFTRSIKSLNLAGLNELRLTVRRSGEGTIVFGPEPPTLTVWMHRSIWWSRLRAPPAPRFDTIREAGAVALLIRAAQQRARDRE